jgi:hypothetical protein
METGSNHKTKVTVALLGLLGVLATAIFSNWDKLFPPAPAPEMKSSLPIEQPRKSVETTKSLPPIEQPQKSVKTRIGGNTLLLKESFEDNSNGWAIAKNGGYYNSYFEDGKYVIETKNEGASPEMIAMKSRMPENFDLEVTTIWRHGVNNSRYGLALGIDRETFYTFGVSGNGQAVVGITKEGKAIMPEPIVWKPGSARVGNGFTENRLRIEVRGEKISYYVNEKHIGDIFNSIILEKWAVGAMVQGEQKVAFDNMILTSR